MMRHGDPIAVAVRTPAKDIVIKEQDYIPFTKRYPVLGIRVVRGSVTLVRCVILGIETRSCTPPRSPCRRARRSRRDGRSPLRSA